MFIYTAATVAFFLLGAGVLHTRGMVPSANDMIPVLSKMYTETLGHWALWLFYPGAIATLYGTIFAATAAESRIAADLCRLLGLFRADDYRTRVRYRRKFVWILTAIGAGLFLIFQSPVTMVKVGGISQAIMLPVISIGALYMRYRRLPKEVLPKKWITVALWAACRRGEQVSVTQRTRISLKVDVSLSPHPWQIGIREFWMEFSSWARASPRAQRAGRFFLL